MSDITDTPTSTSAAPGPIMADPGEIPLPPPELLAQLDNSGDGEAEKVNSSSTARRAVPEVEALEFVGESLPVTEIPLRYPFRWQGETVRTITVRRLTVAQMGAFWEGLPDDGAYERSDLYGVMCGLPGKVIRALPDVDGTRVTKACFDFLPREFGGVSD